jgi:hypothetical protein
MRRLQPMNWVANFVFLNAKSYQPAVQPAQAVAAE